jgi:hypothetical protein
MRRKRGGIYPLPLCLHGAPKYNVVFTLLKILKIKSIFSAYTSATGTGRRKPFAFITETSRWILCREILKQWRFRVVATSGVVLIWCDHGFLFAVFCCSKRKHCNRSTSQERVIYLFAVRRETKSLYVSSHNNVRAVALRGTCLIVILLSVFVVSNDTI